MTLLLDTDEAVEEARTVGYFHNAGSPSAKPKVLNLLRCQGLAVTYYSFMGDALDLQHPLLQHSG
jgi:hypothetical protein